MSHLACPKCRQVVSDDTLDTGQCPACGYDGAMMIRANRKWAWLAATFAIVGVGLAVGAYLLVPRQQWIRQARTQLIPPVSPTPARLPKPVKIDVAPAPRPVAREVKPVAKVQPAPQPHALSPPKKESAPARVGPVIRINAKEVHEKQIHNPDGVVLAADLNSNDHLTLTGQVRLLKIGTVGGKASLDASGLVAEEIVITGDVNDHAVVKLNAPNGKVMIGGHVEGSARLTVNAPGGEVIVAAQSGKLDDNAEVAIVTKDLDVKGKLAGQTRLILTLTGGGMASVGSMEETVVVIYK
jgi:hypothetical protein